MIRVKLVKKKRLLLKKETLKVMILEKIKHISWMIESILESSLSFDVQKEQWESWRCLKGVYRKELMRGGSERR
ncbi:unnamed protein product [Sphenostylis stenocarpa]|uniref:Uncharacterized protein n=1 Tax=Sphenostylis stenocarpa TaxID=92480 RepID=A0AA86VP51_9FABA|nr:unnamed protein product [Sphenostylis stenocarpa]